MNTTGIGGSVLASSCCRSRPLNPGSRTSRTRHLGESGRNALRIRSADTSIRRLRWTTMSGSLKTAIVTGASQGIGAGIVNALVERGFNVVANSRKMTQSTEVAASEHVALVDGHIGEPATAAEIVETALSRFKSIDVVVNNAGIFFTKPFIDYTADDFKSLVSTNLEGFLYITQLAIKQ